MFGEEGRGRASAGSWGCRMCGGRMTYDIGSGDLKCLSCGKYAELALYDEPEPPEDGMMDVSEFSCSQCGAALQTTDTSITGMCSYCGSGLSFRQRMTRARRPAKIVPFKVKREQCAEIYANRMQRARFAPRDAREEQDAKHFRPIYVPFYAYTEQWEGRFTAQSVYRHSDDEYNYTDTYRINGTADVMVRGEAQCASSQFEPEIAERLELDVGQAVPFRPGYLCGFYAEAPDMDANLKESELEFIAETGLGVEVTAKVRKGETTPVLPEKVRDDCEIVLMPVWLLARADGERVLYTAINGVDGTIVCDTPTEPRRPLLLGLGVGALIALALVLLSGTVILRANVIAGVCSLLAAVGFMMVNHARRQVTGREKRLKEQREVKRCQPMKKEEYKHAVLSAKHNQVVAEIPLLILTAVAGFLTVLGGIALINAGLDGNLFPFLFMVTGADALWFITWNKRRAERAFASPLQEWFMVWFLKAVILVVGVYAFIAFETNTNNAIAGLVGDKGWLPPVMCGFAFLTTLWKRPPAGGPVISTLCCWLSALLCAAGCVMMPLVHHQLVYYSLAAVQMLLLLVTMYNQITHYNEYVSRPVPYFGREGVRV